MRDITLRNVTPLLLYIYTFRDEGLYWACVFRGTLYYKGLNRLYDFVTRDRLFP